MKTSRKSRGKIILRNTERNANKTISAAVEAGLQVIQNLAPYDHGDLESTCQKRDDGNGHGMLMAGGPSQISDKFVDYQLDVEFGTDKQAAQPFFRPGVEKAKTVIKSGMKIVG
jgi:hypothetical protein